MNKEDFNERTIHTNKRKIKEGLSLLLNSYCK